MFSHKNQEIGARSAPKNHFRGSRISAENLVNAPHCFNQKQGEGGVTRNCLYTIEQLQLTRNRDLRRIFRARRRQPVRNTTSPRIADFPRRRRRRRRRRLSGPPNYIKSKKLLGLLAFLCVSGSPVSQGRRLGPRRKSWAWAWSAGHLKN